jgi:protein-S-isoprenylcysteine O-methyltransferase Ste14
MLRWPVYLTIGSLFFGTSFLLWRPIPLSLPPVASLLMLVFGTLLYFSGLTLVLWGRFALGKMYNVSSSMGAYLYADHQLVTQGPFAFVRHPMYLGIIGASVGGLFTYRTWTFIFLAIVFFGLVFRAKHEEQVLAAEFGEQWERYCQQVPGWIPRVWRRDHKTTMENLEKEP